METRIGMKRLGSDVTHYNYVLDSVDESPHDGEHYAALALYKTQMRGRDGQQKPLRQHLGPAVCSLENKYVIAISELGQYDAADRCLPCTIAG